MELADLRLFAAVARHRSMNRAAEELNTVQSAVTARVRALEEELGIPLFRRHSRGVELTEAGNRLLPYVARMTRLLADARDAAHDTGTPSGPLLIGSLETTAAFRLPSLLARYVDAHPQVALQVRTGSTREMIDEVLGYRLDGALVAGPVKCAAIAQTTVFTEELMLATAPHVTTIEAPARPIVFGRGCAYRVRIEDVLARRGLAPLASLEFGSVEAIIGCVAAGMGVALLPRSALEGAARDGRVALHALPPEDAMIQTVFIRRTDVRMSSALAAFLALCSGDS